jgi:hypothetical protein
MGELRTVADRSRITEHQRQFGELLMDATARSQVERGRFETVDDFYRALSVESAERYVPGPGEALLKRVWDTPSFRSLERLLAKYEDAPLWYERSGQGLAEHFGGIPVTLRDGSTIDGADLVAQIIAVTSGGAKPNANMTFALNDLSRWLAGEPVRGGRYGRNQVPLIEAILSGDHMGVNPGRWKKYEPFRRALLGDPDAVVIDRRMKFMFGLSEDVSPAEQEFAVDLIKRLADSTGLQPRVVQERLWVAFGEHFDTLARSARRRGDGELAETFQKLADGVRSKDANLDYLDLLETPKYGARAQEVRSQLEAANPLVLAQRVEDEILGATKYGDDFSSVMTFFRSADFGTLVHENAHVLRRLLSPQDLDNLEKAYIGRSGRWGRNPFGAEVREIAQEYMEKAGIPFDRAAVDEFASVDEARAMRIADAFDAAKHEPNKPAVKRAYTAFKNETLAQYDFLVSKGYKPIPSTRDPYPNSAAFTKDIQETKTLRYFKSGDLGDNPLGELTGRVVKDVDGNDYDQSYNDIFRWVHDIFGHAKEGMQTAARGEENAWRQHMRMYTPVARKAMTTETRGQNSWVNFGKHLRNEEGRVPVKGEPGYVPLTERPYSEQKVTLLPDEFSELPYEARWPREAEERFAEDMERVILGKLDPQGSIGVLRDAIGSLWSKVRPAATETNLVPREMRHFLDQTFKDMFDVVPASRARGALQAAGSKQVLAGAAVGAAAGAAEGDSPGDILRGAAIGAGGGLLTRGALRRTYGYLPDYLTRLNTALRYTLSFTFDAGRYSEQNLIAATKYGLPPMLSPKKYTMARTWKRSPFTHGEVTRERAWKDAVRLWDELNGTSWFTNIDDIDRRMYQAGLLGFSPRNWEIAQAWQLYQRGMSADKISEAISNIGRYGLGRTAAEKSANFLFFPFSFSKKLITTLGDFFLQAPGRAVLLHEGMRRYYESELDEGVHDFIERRAPLLNDLAMINNLAFGISPGRFFLQGLSDHRSMTGKAMQLMASVFVPSGAATPLAQASGGIGDVAVNAFAPIIVTGESIDRAGGIDGIDDIMRRYIPFVRELDQYFLKDNSAVSSQITAITQGAEPFYQYSKYQDDLREMKAEYEPLALAMGYSSVDGLLNSDVGMAIRPQLDQQREALQEQFPTGFKMSQQFENQDALNARALVDLANKSNRSEGEDAILHLAEEVEKFKMMNEILGMDPQIMEGIAAQAIRAEALKYANDRRFAELYDMIFARNYGPIRKVA